jgi:formylglycine-generating enzyme required for sulfatase activity
MNMKKLYPLFFVILAGALLATTACGLSGNNAQPTAMSFATAVPTQAVGVNPTEKPQGNANSGEERTSPTDGMIQVFIPDGSFTMGGMDAGTGPDEQPAHKVTISGFWMDKVEVTNSMYSLCVQAGACEPPKLFTSAQHETYFNDPNFAEYPVIMVRWRDANAYCSWAGRRLPYEAEWEYAARGTDLRTWPWGDQRADSSLANFNYSVGDTIRVGSYPAGASPFGILDMAGNVWEWMADWYNANYYINAPIVNPTGPLAPLNGNLKVIRGGSWQDGEVELRVPNRGFTTGGDENAQLNSDAYNGTASNTIGFRCVANK